MHNFEPPAEVVVSKPPRRSTPPLAGSTPSESRPPTLRLEDNDIYLTSWARTRARVRGAIKIMAYLAIPFIIAQAMAFGSFIYEESLQAAGFAVRSALIAEDQALALDACRTFEDVMRRAQSYQRNVGRMAFWTHEAFETYFGLSAPAQLMGFYGEGKARGLWEDDQRRWKLVDTGAGPAFVDTWKLNPRERLEALGFNPDLLNNRRCAACRAREESTEEVGYDPQNRSRTDLRHDSLH